jgi:hypothetical protein
LKKKGRKTNGNLSWLPRKNSPLFILIIIYYIIIFYTKGINSLQM